MACEQDERINARPMPTHAKWRRLRPNRRWDGVLAASAQTKWQGAESHRLDRRQQAMLASRRITNTRGARPIGPHDANSGAAGPTNAQENCWPMKNTTPSKHARDSAITTRNQWLIRTGKEDAKG
jgi:hypothetical protein